MRKLAHDLIRILSVEFIIILALAGLVTLGYLFRKPLFITYHRLGSRSALNTMRRPARPEMRRESYSKYGN